MKVLRKFFLIRQLIAKKEFPDSFPKVFRPHDPTPVLEVPTLIPPSPAPSPSSSLFLLSASAPSPPTAAISRLSPVQFAAAAASRPLLAALGRPLVVFAAQFILFKAAAAPAAFPAPAAASAFIRIPGLASSAASAFIVAAAAAAAAAAQQRIVSFIPAHCPAIIRLEMNDAEKEI
jgi:hypothetical protein